MMYLPGANGRDVHVTSEGDASEISVRRFCLVVTIIVACAVDSTAGAVDSTAGVVGAMPMA